MALPLQPPIAPRLALRRATLPDHPGSPGGHRTGDRIPVTVTCIVAPTHDCDGRLTLVQQNSRRKLGHTSFAVALSASKTIPVRVSLTPGLKRLRLLATVATVTAGHGPSTSSVIDVTHTN